MLTLDKQWLAADGLDPDRDIMGTIGFAGPYDFLPLHDPELETIFGPAGDLRLTQPITFARGKAPPIFLGAGTADQTVLPSNTEHLTVAIRRDGGSVEERLYPGVNHTKIIGALAGVLRWLAPSRADAVSFLDRHDGRSAFDPAGSAMAGLTSTRVRGKPPTFQKEPCQQGPGLCVGGWSTSSAFRFWKNKC